MKKTFLILLPTVLAALIALIYTANSYVNDNSIPKTELATSTDRVLLVFAHPDDEITVAGTLAGLNAKNIPTALLYLTRGEKGPTGGLVPREKLGEARTKEVHSIKEILGIDYMRVFDFPDGGIPGASSKEIKEAILKSLNEFKPTIVIGFDETVGLYGHEDHRLAGLYLHQLLEQSRPKYVKKYFMVTFPEPIIQLALKISKMFRERYPQEPGKGLPEAHVAVTIWKYAPLKKQVLEAHKTQWEVINDVQPYAMMTPAYLYYRIFDREYYHRVELGE